MQLRWTVQAAADLESIKDYLHQHFPHFAEPTVRTIYKRIAAIRCGLFSESASDRNSAHLSRAPDWRD